MEEQPGSFPRVPARRKPRWGTLALVLLLHVLAIVALARAFAPQLTDSVVRQAASVLTVTITAPSEPPPPSPPPATRPPEPDEGAAAPEGKQAMPREVTAPVTRLPVKPLPAPLASSTGNENRSGARDEGEGTGAGGEGAGTGSGQSGTGQGGGGGGRKLEKIAGDINSAKDYPKKSRDLRIGHSVTILLTVGTDGRVTDCTVTEPSPDAEADAITCRLARERFRFNPALDAQGNAMIGKFRWRQRWFF
ncbi:TonB family protein [Altererythrobacter sp. CC-YST694]|uniref:TonB family protein n=1 Tax=Altererythrobacter sp. CC-YST694 TaxID=2755038 RepID=UPI001D004CE7|nr:TonB family protein [Altererythrobacter sp. CC-YST694]MCB5426533.1 TonB family protein [Altererythrobacter sp. CC-YST694]